MRLRLDRWLPAICLLLLSMLPPAGGSAELPPIEGPLDGFIRFYRHTQTSATLDTSVRIYRHARTRQVVALVGAVHIGDRSYYHAVQRELDRFDLVLFERVGRDGEKEAEPDPGLTQFALLQREFAKVLDFTHQMENLDYGRKNFRHADVSLEEFQRLLAERGGVVLFDDWALRLLVPLARLDLAMLESMKAQDPLFTTRLRWQFAVMLSSLEQVLEELGINKSENPDDVIIGLRNDHAWKVLEKARGEGYQRLAIFYGAAHMPDFQRRLYEEGFELEETRWLSAWKIPTVAEPLEAIPPAPSAVKDL